MRKLFELDPYTYPKTIFGQPPSKLGNINRSLLNRFQTALAKSIAVRSEAPMQKFFEANPSALVSLISPHDCWLFPRLALQKSLGGGWEIDFKLCDWTSLGPEWTIIELESPTEKPLNSRGISGILRHAEQQIGDYRQTMKKHTERNESDGLVMGHRLNRSWIIIGRRGERTRMAQDRLADLRQNDIEVASYDRVFESCQRFVEYRTQARKRHNERRKKVLWRRGSQSYCYGCCRWAGHFL